MIYAVLILVYLLLMRFMFRSFMNDELADANIGVVAYEATHIFMALFAPVLIVCMLIDAIFGFRF